MGEPDAAAGGSAKPSVLFACLCERALLEKDNVVSLVRIVDVFEMPAEIGAAEDGAARPGLEFFIAIGAHRNGALGEHTFSLALQRPTGERSQLGAAYPVFFEEGGGGANLLVRFVLTRPVAGAFLFDVLYDGEPFARIPFTLRGRTEESAKSTPPAKARPPR